MSNFIKHNGSLINLNTIQEIKIHVFKENGKDKYSVVMVKLDNSFVSFGVFDDHDTAQNSFDHVAANIEYLEIVNANGSTNMFDL